ncbi:MAG: NAD(P)-dependent oxidoreductase [Brevinema sp.]
MANIVIGDDIAAIEALELLHASSHTIFFGMENIGIADALIVRSLAVTKTHIEQAPNLKIISRAGVGMDAIDTVFAESKGILCYNVPGGNSTCASEHTLGLMLSLAHNITKSHGQIEKHIWDRTTTEGFDLFGRTLGVIGCGNVGAKVSRLAMNFGMKVLVYDPYINEAPATMLGSLEELIPQCNILTLHVPLTDETLNMISDKELSLLKTGGCLINASRGAVVDVEALVKHAPRLRGIALDVFPKEPIPNDSPLRQLPNIVMTAHLGGASTDARRTVAVGAVNIVLDFLGGLDK